MNSCSNSPSEKLGEFTGNSGEILLVHSNDFNNQYKDSVKNILEYQTHTLPQTEKAFTVYSISDDKLSGVYKTHRTILFLKRSSDKNEFFIKNEIWAKNQTVLTFNADGSEESLIYLHQKMNIIAPLINKKELVRSQLFLEQNANKSVQKTINKHFGFNLKIPKDYYLAKSTNTVIWLRKETNVTSQGIIIYSVKNDIKNFKIAIDSILKANIPGTAAGSFMAISRFDDFSTPEIERGIWETKNDFMGGPYVSYSYPDVNNNRTIFVLGFVYAPSKKKRELLREVEAIASSGAIN